MFDENIKFIDGRRGKRISEGHIKGAVNIDYKEFKIRHRRKSLKY